MRETQQVKEQLQARDSKVIYLLCGLAKTRGENARLNNELEAVKGDLTTLSLEEAEHKPRQQSIDSMMPTISTGEADAVRRIAAVTQHNASMCLV